jgi:hypothetical protein
MQVLYTISALETGGFAFKQWKYFLKKEEEKTSSVRYFTVAFQPFAARRRV